MIKILTIGIDKSEFPVLTNDFVIAQHSPGPAKGMSYYEYYIKCKKMAKEADILVVKNPSRNFTEDEVILIDTAYTNKTPVFGVGDTGIEGVLKLFITNWFMGMEEVFDHVQAYY